MVVQRLFQFLLEICVDALEIFKLVRFPLNLQLQVVPNVTEVALLKLDLFLQPQILDKEALLGLLIPNRPSAFSKAVAASPAESRFDVVHDELVLDQILLLLVGRRLLWTRFGRHPCETQA